MSFEVVVDRSAQYPAITLKNTVSGSEAEIYGFGALLNAFRLPVKGRLLNVVDGFSSVADATDNITNGFKSAKLSPFVCRLNNGTYTFGEKQYKVNSFYMGDHAIHGLLYNRSFEIINTSVDLNHAAVQLQYKYSGADEGYPFSFTMQVAWKLEPGKQTGDRLTVTTSFTNNHSLPIPLADGWHPFFTLGTGLDACSLQFNTGMQVAFSSDLLPTGNIIADERFVHSISMKGIELDNCFLLDPSKEPSYCLLKNGTVSLLIEPDASYPYLQIYTPPHRKSIAIENLTGAPDTFNNGIGLMVLNAGESRNFVTSYTVMSDAMISDT